MFEPRVRQINLPPYVSRRRFLEVTSGVVSGLFLPGGLSAQTFSVGAIPVGKTTIANGRTEVLGYCDELMKLGFRRFEVNNTRAGIAEYYGQRVEEFKDLMERRQLTLVGLAQYSKAGRQGNLTALLEQHMLIGRFLTNVGGKYITHMLAPGEILNESDESAYRDLDVKVWARNLNEIGYRLYDQYGVKLGYHPLRPEIIGDMYKRILDLTHERYVFLIPDIGHLVAGGADPINVCKIYRNRIVAVHLKDFSPNVIGDKRLKAGNVSFGQGIANLPGVISELQRTKFAGWILGESGGTNQDMRDYMVHSLHVNL
jgi:inosose dehydratase